ncbi:hypothetical protein CHU98_g11833 [Xylaria longipes]|nr:hypothetical protein CHU98_g11833 [Xylaria longipes]
MVMMRRSGDWEKCPALALPGSSPQGSPGAYIGSILRSSPPQLRDATVGPVHFDILHLHFNPDAVGHGNRRVTYPAHSLRHPNYGPGATII